jgi:hypothetical protein
MRSFSVSYESCYKKNGFVGLIILNSSVQEKLVENDLLLLKSDSWASLFEKGLENVYKTSPFLSSF